MFSLPRFLLYCALTLPHFFYINMTFLDQRAVWYELLGVFIGSVLAAYAVDSLLVRKRSDYREWKAGRGARWTARAAKTPTIVLIVLALPGLTFVPIGFGLFPTAFAVFLAVHAAWIGLGYWKGAVWPTVLRPTAPLVVLPPILFSLGCMFATALGSMDGTCAALERSPYLKPLITRSQIAARSDIESCFPYDVKSDPEADRLFFTLKQRRSGFLKLPWRPEVAQDAIGSIPFRNPDFSRADLITILTDSTATYPQRITVDAPRKRLFVVVLDIDGGHAVRVVEYADGFRQTASIPVDYEPIRAYIDRARDRLLILDYEGAVGAFDPATFKRTFYRRVASAPFMTLIDTFVYNPARHGYYASSVSGEFMFLSDEYFSPVVSRRLGIPTIGLDYDAASDRVYAAGTLTREILELDGVSLEVIDRIKTGTTVRELYIDQARGLILTAGYTDGYFDALGLSDHRRVFRLFVGRLARSIHWEPISGRVFVASSCGLWELDMDRLLADGPGAQP